MQSKRDTHKEVMINNILGVIAGLVAIRILVPLLEGLDPNVQTVVIVFCMFCLSYTRGYLIRRFFNRRIMR